MQGLPRAYRFAGWLMMTLALLLPAIGGAATPRDEPIRIAFIGSSTDSAHFAPVYAGIRAVAELPAGRDSRPLEVLNWTPATPRASLQADALRRAFVEGMDGVILSPVDGERLAPVIAFLNEQNIPVITVNGDTAALQGTAHSGAAPADIGRRLADELIRAMGQRPGPVAILGGNPQSLRSSALLSGAIARLEAANIPIHGIFESREDAAALDVVRQVTRSDRDRTIRGWIFPGPWPLISGESMPWLPHRLPAVAADVMPIALRYVDNRQIAAVVAEDYFSSGQQATRMMLHLLNGAAAEPLPDQDPAIWVITPENVSEHRQKWVRWMQ